MGSSNAFITFDDDWAIRWLAGRLQNCAGFLVLASMTGGDCCNTRSAERVSI